MANLMTSWASSILNQLVISFLTFISLSLFKSLGQSDDSWGIQILLVNATLKEEVTICTTTAKNRVNKAKINIFSTSFSIFGWKKSANL
jgi:hypothetical protein